jgi:hypothetical protein
MSNCAHNDTTIISGENFISFAGGRAAGKDTGKFLRLQEAERINQGPSYNRFQNS